MRERMLRWVPIDGNRGAVCLVSTSRLWTIPSEQTCLWALNERTDVLARDAFAVVPGLEDGDVPCITSDVHPWVEIRTPCGGTRRIGTVRGDQQAFRVEESPVARPKCRLQLRWNCGHWEKLSSRDGWIIT